MIIYLKNMQRSKILIGLSLLLMSVTANTQETIVLKKQSSGLFNVSGMIRDAATGKALRGIKVTYKEFSAAITDSLGAFTLDVPSSDVSILLEGEGYQSKQVALKGKNRVTAALYEDTYNSFYDLANHPLNPIRKS